MDNKNIKKRIYEVISVARRKDIPSKIFDVLIITLIVLNVLILIIETYDVSEGVKASLKCFEIFSMIVFTIEYILRIWTAEYLFPDSKKYIARAKYIFSLTGIIDLLAILPLYLPNSLPKGIIIIRSCRTLRVLKLLKINKRFDTLKVVANVLKKKFTQLISTFYVIAFLMTTSSIMMYNAEHAAQPEKFKNAFSGLWWTVSTIATIGYGDIYPITTMGKILGIIITILGVSIIAIPTAVLTAGFIEESEKETKRKDMMYCPHCGEKLED